MPGPGEGNPLAFISELIVAVWRRAMTPLRIAWRRGWLYRLQLRGRMPAGIEVPAPDFSLPRLDQADALLRGRFTFGGDVVEVKEGSVFDNAAPSPQWLESLHGFAWLASLSTAGGDAASSLASRLIGDWLKRNARYSEPAWRADILGKRLLNLLAHGPFVLAKADVLWRSKLLVALREQSRMLARISREAPDGVPRLEAAAAHALSGICLDDSPKRLGGGLERLEQELARQILPDGGHASRSPQALLCAYQLLATVIDALERADQPVPAALLSARDRMAPMLRFFRLGDGALAMFNGGREGDAKAIAALMARDEVRGQPFAFAPHSGYQRLAAGRTLLVMDCGPPPKGAFATAAHAGCLAFEFSAANQRLVVNCGASPDQRRWGGLLRATAAHSTIAVADRSMAGLLTGKTASLLGPRLVGGPGEVATERQETASGWTVEATHNGYVPLFGILHQRRLTLSPNGRALSGEDRLIPKAIRKRREALPFAARFHIHPDIRVSASQGGGALLKLPSGEGWRFQASGGALTVEKSVYVPGDSARRCEQLVLSGVIRNEPVHLGWQFEHAAPS